MDNLPQVDESFATDTGDTVTHPYLPVEDTNSNFVMPPYPEDVPQVSEEKANADAFYANAHDSEDPVNDIIKTKTELMQTGSSPAVDEANANSIKEQDQAMTDTLIHLKGLGTPKEYLAQIISSYAERRIQGYDLRDRYMMKTASVENGDTLEDTLSQDLAAEHLPTVTDSMKTKENKALDLGLVDDIGNYVGAGLLKTNELVAGIAASIPAGLGFYYKLLKDRDPDKASAFALELLSSIQGKLSAKTKDEGTLLAKDKIDNLLHKYLNWGDKAGSIANEAISKLSPTSIKANAAISTGVNIAGMLVEGLVLGKATGLDFKPGSIMDATRKSNIKAAGELARKALEDDTGKIAGALNTDIGTIVQETILPKIDLPKFDETNPDLSAYIKQIDKEVENSFNYARLDPSLIDMAQREADLNLILKVKQETGMPYYQQANSVLTSPSTNVFEGKAVYGRSADGFFTKKADAEKAYEKVIEVVDKATPSESGFNSSVVLRETPKGEWYVEHTWRKEYDPLDYLTFGAEAIDTRILGIPINTLKNTPVGKWITSIGKTDPLYDQSKARAVDRAAKQSNDINRIVRDNISNSPHKAELNKLVDLGEQTGIEYFSKADISTKFPHLSVSQVDDLFNTHIVWRRVAHYQYRILNDMVHRELQTKGYSSVYDEANQHVADVHVKLGDDELGLIKHVYDMQTKSIVDLGKTVRDSMGAVLDSNHRQVVRLYEAITDTAGNKFNYALLHPAHKVDILRSNPLPRISGWSPREHINHFYIDKHNPNMKIDGHAISKETARANKTTVAAAKTQYEADKILANLQAKDPSMVYESRLDRLDNATAVVKDYNVSADIYATARKRGQGLQNSTIEDRLKTLIDTSTALAYKNNMLAWEQATQQSFIKNFGSKGKYNFLPDGFSFPRGVDELRLPQNPTKDMIKEFAAARTILEDYTRFKEFSFTTDKLWKSGLHYAADVLEKIHIPGNLIRDYAKHSNPFMLGKKIGSFLYINTNIPRQWFIQPQQALELYALDPLHAPKAFADTQRIALHLMGDHTALAQPMGGIIGKTIKWIARKGQFGSSEQDLLNHVKAIKESGIIDSIDTNVLVHGMFHDQAKLVTGVTDRVVGAIKAPFSTVNKVGRTLGYDPSEIYNKIGIWVQMKNIWEKQNPGKDWNTPAAKEKIAFDTFRYSGGMNKAGNLPYQVGMLSPLFQFSAIGHKTFINALQNTATSLSTAQRMRLGAIRATTMGIKYGVPGGGLLYMYIDKYGSPETQKNANVVKRGLADMAVNSMLNSYFPDPNGKTDLDISASISPFGSNTGVPYADQVMETLKLVDGKETTNPRYPVSNVAHSLYDLHSMWGVVWNDNDYTTPEKFTLGFKQSLTVLPLFNNYFQMQHIIGTGQAVDKLGNPNGIPQTVAEGYAKIIGIPSAKTNNYFDMLKTNQDNEQHIKDVAKTIYEGITREQNFINPDGSKVDVIMAYSHALNLAVSDEGFTEEAKTAVLKEVLSLAMRNPNIQENVIRNWIEDNRKLSDINREHMLQLLEADPDPKMQDLAKSARKGIL